MGDESPEISVIIVNYNTRQMTLECLRSLFHELNDFNSEVLLVDNASTDNSAEAIRSAFPQVKLIDSQRNLGFGGGNNLALQRAKGRYFMLLNTDAFLKPNAVGELIAYMERNSNVALVGPKLLNRDGSLQRSCFRFPSPARAWAENFWISVAFGSESKFGDYRRWAHDRERIVDWVIGACCLVRRHVYDQIGGFDEQFFMYAEETDWQRSMRSAGWEIGFTPAAEVIHLGGTSGASERSRINRYFFNSLDLYEVKHHGTAGLLSLRAAMVGGCFLRLLAWMGVLAFVPTRRAAAKTKLRLLSWLLCRQLTQWRLA